MDEDFFVLYNPWEVFQSGPGSMFIFRGVPTCWIHQSFQVWGNGFCPPMQTFCLLGSKQNLLQTVSRSARFRCSPTMPNRYVSLLFHSHTRSTISTVGENEKQFKNNMLWANALAFMHKVEGVIQDMHSAWGALQQRHNARVPCTSIHSKGRCSCAWRS